MIKRLREYLAGDAKPISKFVVTSGGCFVHNVFAFLPIVFAGYWLVRRAGVRRQNAFILVVSYMFTNGLTLCGLPLSQKRRWHDLEYL